MNRKLPYEELIAEQLRHLQLPDQNELWQQMKAELDTAMPVAPKKRAVPVKWWKMGVIFLVMIGGTWWVWNTIGTTEDKNLLLISGINGESSKQALLPSSMPSVKNQETYSTSVSDKNFPQPKNIRKESKVLFTPPAIDDPISNHQESAMQIGFDSPGNRSVLTPYSDNSLSSFNVAPSRPVTSRQVSSTIADLSKRENIIHPTKENPSGILSVPRYVTVLPDVSARKKLLLKEMKRQERKEEKELAKSYRTHHSFWGESTDRWFAAGLAPYQNINIAAQQSYHYNSSAGRNIITDYIPSPYLQLHVTNRIYLLSEFQFNAPQATPSILLSQKAAAVPINSMGYTENIYLRKLYYFNMPVSFYYSPIKNFYLGSGLQFSSFNSGLADIEQRSANNTLLHSETVKLKDDSLSTLINGSEWRYLFDANYYYNRFMFGLRYNQALTPFSNFRVNNAIAPTHTRNQAFQLYIRYNLVVSGRK